MNAHKYGMPGGVLDEPDEDWEWDDCTVWEQRCWPDLALVPPECDGVAVRALFYRQLKSCGFPTWLDPRPTLPRSAVHLRLFFWATDAGPDQVACSGIVEGELAANPLDLHLHEFCLFHKVQLIDMKILKRCAETWFGRLVLA